MNECCTLIKELDCIYSCDLVQIGVNSPSTGSFTIELLPDNIKLVTTTQTIATPMVFPAGHLNEDGVSLFKIVKPDGTYYTTADGEDCFQVKVKPNYNPELANVDIVPVACDAATYENSDASYSLSIASGATGVGPDITITEVDLSTTTSVANADVTCNAALCPQTTSIIFNPIAIGDDTSGLFTNPGTTMTLTSISDDGGSGTITVSVNGGAYAAFVNPTTVLITETLQVKRTTTTGEGTVTITGTYA